MKIQPHTKKEYGFTLVEVLISLTLFSIAITGVITVAAQGGINVNAARNRVTATYLADEGLELMRGFRDTNIVSAGIGFETTGWNNFVTSSTPCQTAVCDIDPTNVGGGISLPFPAVANIVPCPLGICHLYHTTTGYYTSITDGLPTTTVSMFSRGISVSIVSPTEVHVTSTVTWNEGVLPQSVVVDENLFNWYN